MVFVQEHSNTNVEELEVIYEQRLGSSMAVIEVQILRGKGDAAKEIPRKFPVKNLELKPHAVRVKKYKHPRCLNL